MSEQATISRRSGYTAVPNHIFSDERLSLDARAFLGLIMSMREGWVFRRANLMKIAGIGRDKYQRITRELQDTGYLEIRNIHSDDGQFVGKEWVINDDPDQEGETQDVDTEGLKTCPTVTEGLKNRKTVLPADGETRPLKNNNSNKKPNDKPPNPPRGARRRDHQFGVSENLRLLVLGDGS